MTPESVAKSGKGSVELRGTSGRFAMSRLLGALSLALLLCLPAAARDVAPATIVVEIASTRQGVPSQKVGAKVRLGERILLRDERKVPYVVASGANGQKTDEVVTGMVLMVVPEVVNSRLSFRMEAYVRDVERFERRNYSPDGKNTYAVSWPEVRSRRFDANVDAPPVEGGWKSGHEFPETGFAVSIAAKPLVALR